MLSAGSSHSKGGKQGEEGEVRGDPGVPLLASVPVVAAGGEAAGVPALPPAPSQAGPDTSGGGQDQSVSQPSSGSTYFRESLALSSLAVDLDNADIDFLSQHLAPGSSSGYCYV